MTDWVSSRYRSPKVLIFLIHNCWGGHARQSVRGLWLVQHAVPKQTGGVFGVKYTQSIYSMGARPLRWPCVPQKGKPQTESLPRVRGLTSPACFPGSMTHFSIDTHRGPSAGVKHLLLVLSRSH